jgi:hypothetical protein
VTKATTSVKTNIDLAPTEAIVDVFCVYGVDTYGCVKTGTGVMVNGTVKSDPRNGGKPTFYDLFCTLDQARDLHASLGKLLERVDQLARAAARDPVEVTK